MPKLDVLISVKSNDSNQEYKTTAILTEEIIKYKSEDNTTEMFDYTNNNLTRENSELRMDYVFDLNNLFIEARVNITMIKPPHIYGKNL